MIDLMDKAFVMMEGDLMGTAKPAEDYREISPPKPPPNQAKEFTGMYGHVQPVIDGLTLNLMGEERAKAMIDK